jgi:hypothetical protein
VTGSNLSVCHAFVRGEPATNTTKTLRSEVRLRSIVLWSFDYVLAVHMGNGSVIHITQGGRNKHTSELLTAIRLAGLATWPTSLERNERRVFKSALNKQRETDDVD